MDVSKSPAAAPAPALFDSALEERRLQRAARLAAPADFLLRRAAEDLRERLGAIKRRFTRIADALTPGAAFGAAALELYPGANLAVHGITANGALDLGAGRFDLIVSGLRLHHANDLPGVLAQIRHALKPDGLLLGCMAGGATLTELRQSLAEAESAVTGGISPRVAPFADIRGIGGLLQRAGLALPVADSETVTVRYGDMAALMADLRAMGATNVLTGRLRRPTRRSVFTRAATFYAERFSDADGRIRATFETLWFSGWAPHENQQQPLRPGSARSRLADALGVTETAAGEKAGGS